MGLSYRTAKIGGRKIRYSLNQEEGVYEFDLAQGSFTLKTWNWGEKNRVLEECISFDEQSSEFLLDVARFNEYLLLTTLKSVRLNGRSSPIELPTIRNFDAGLGDLLLDICRWLNCLDGNQTDNDRGLKVHKHVDTDGMSVIMIGDYRVKFRMWSWGEKNRILNQCIAVDERKQVNISTRQFNELMLLSTITEVRYKGEEVALTLDFLQQLDHQAGDVLLETAQEINEISVPEKKNYNEPSD